MFLNQIATVSRLTPSVDTDKESYQNVSGLVSIPINVQPATAELTVMTQGVLGQTFLAFTPASGIKIGDRVTVSGQEDPYLVNGVSDWSYDPIPHLEIVLVKTDD